jgi:hypothetical protein
MVHLTEVAEIVVEEEEEFLVVEVLLVVLLFQDQDKISQNFIY